MFILDVLPTRSDGAAANMATDFLLLQRYPAAGHVRFRHYGWHRPAVTFGYSQKLNWVRDKLRTLHGEGDALDTIELCRRPTGGGVVDHRADWTYTLVLPREHPLTAGRLIELYRVVHTALADALREQGCEAELKQRCEASDADDACAGAGVCFRRPELYDVVRVSDGAKLAGAALKRGKRGLLLQGSIARDPAALDDWESFGESFIDRLARVLDCTPASPGSFQLDDDEVSALAEQYASSDWLEQR